MVVTVSFKTLTQSTFSLDLDENLTIAEVKVKLSEGRGDEFSPELQKLIYNGKILEDNLKVADVGFESHKFVVVMLLRKKVAEPTSTSASAVAETAPAEPEKPKPSDAAPKNAASTTESTPAPAPLGESSITAEQEKSVEAISGMGYPRDQVIAALRAAYWNADRAVEFLINGIPEGLVEESSGFDGAQIAGEDELESEENLSALQNLPQLPEIRALIRNNPEMLGAVLQQLAVVNPQLVRAIQNNQQAFIDILNNAPSRPSGGNATGGGTGGTEGNQPHVIQLNQDEVDAIQRIKSMGFQVPEAAIIEAYLACDKNEEAAINFILTNLYDQ